MMNCLLPNVDDDFETAINDEDDRRLDRASVGLSWVVKLLRARVSNNFICLVGFKIYSLKLFKYGVGRLMDGGCAFSRQN